MVMAARLRLLYLSPVIPMLTGNGLAMRAGAVLEALTRNYDVDLLVARLYPPFLPAVPEPFASLCRRTAVVSQLRGSRDTRPERPWRGQSYDMVHVFRLAALPFGKPYLGSLFRRPRRHLDLDDIESVTRRRLAALYRQNGVCAQADQEDSEAVRHEPMEAACLRQFDRVYVCSAADRHLLASRGRTRAELCVLPNALRAPAVVPAPSAEALFTFLFVGTLGYYPNEDAARFLCSEIVPRIRELVGDRFAVAIAGAGAPRSLALALNAPQVRFLGEVPDLHPCYAQAHAVLAPIRAGGGTRIKVLEAFSYGRPVVATSVAIEGIEARPDEHVLTGDTAGALARQCARLISDPALCATLARNAAALFECRYTIEALAAALHEMATS
jgi:polysaccharide biosynthesis protein PslH